MIGEKEEQRRRLFGERLKWLRNEKGFTQEYMATELGISITAYMQYERGKREPSNKGLIMIANILGVSSDYLLFGDNANNIEENQYEHAVAFWKSSGYVVNVDKDNVNNIELILNEDKFIKTKNEPLLKIVSFKDRLSFIKFTNYAESEFAKKVDELKKEVSTKVMGKAYLKILDKSNFDSFSRDILNDNSIVTG